jgi:hypothetical protein
LTIANKCHAESSVHRSAIDALARQRIRVEIGHKKAVLGGLVSCNKHIEEAFLVGNGRLAQCNTITIDLQFYAPRKRSLQPGTYGVNHGLDCIWPEFNQQFTDSDHIQATCIRRYLTTAYRFDRIDWKQ